jgi:hypothetical protein
VGTGRGGRNYAKSYDRHATAARDADSRAKTEEFSATREGVEEMLLYNMAPFFTFGRVRGKKYLPAFKLKHLLAELATAMGYALDVRSADYTFNQAILFSWRSATRSFGEQYRSYQYFLPRMTLGEFLNSLRAMGTAIYIDSRTRIITAMPFDAVASQPFQDLTACAVPHPEMREAFTGDASTFAWGQTSEKVPNLPSVPTPFLLPAPSLGDVILVERENRLYEAQAITVGNASVMDWRPIENASLSMSLSRGGMDVQSLFVPVPAGQQFYFTSKNIRIREYSPTGKIRLDGFLYAGLKKAEIQYRILEPEELSTGWYADMNPTGIAADSPVLDIDWTEDHDNAVVEYRTLLSYFGENLMPELPEEVAPYIALHHGVQESEGGGDYIYAGPTGIHPSSGDRLSQQDLTWPSVFSNRMATAKEVIETGKEASYRLFPKVHEAIQFSPIAPVAIDGVFFIPCSFDTELGGVVKGEFRGWVV